MSDDLGRTPAAPELTVNDTRALRTVIDVYQQIASDDLHGDELVDHGVLDDIDQKLREANLDALDE